MPSTTVLTPSLISGSWFPSGYHGHFRSKSRSDLYSDYRQLAKPQPPKAFITRIKERPSTHVFSRHDNRFSFTTDATYLDMGVGKKRRIITAQSSKPTRDLITWDNTVSGGRDFSMYRTAYTAGGVPVQLPLKNPAICRFELDCSAEDRQTSTYRYTYNPAYNPNKEMLDSMCQETLRARPASMRPANMERFAAPCKSAKIRESVAACLIWDSPRQVVHQRPFTAAPLRSSCHSPPVTLPASGCSETLPEVVTSPTAGGDLPAISSPTAQ